MSNYPITELGLNAFAGSDNRDAAGGCYVGRDVHSNPFRNLEAETPSHMNPVGQWLVDNVVTDNLDPDDESDKGIWCTNCHTQLGQELWKAENVDSLVHAKPGDPGHVREPFPGATLADVADGIGILLEQAEAWLDPKTTEDMVAVWQSDPGMCDYVSGLLGGSVSPFQDGGVATIEVNLNIDAGQAAVPVPFSAATDGRDHWLSAGEPHCADCHAAPFVEQSGNINAFAPFNYPQKASLFRYSRGHQDITCQGCHESTHGLYPVTPPGYVAGSTKAVDQTSWDQAAGMNTDGSHGPLKCGACHEVDPADIPTWVDNLQYNGDPVSGNFDRAVSWMHTFTDEADPREEVCRNCHGDRTNEMREDDGRWKDSWMTHAMRGRVSRNTMDKVEIAEFGHVAGDTAFENPRTSACRGCHDDEWSGVSCSGGQSTEWKRHLTQGRVAASVWENVSITRTGSTCDW